MTDNDLLLRALAIARDALDTPLPDRAAFVTARCTDDDTLHGMVDSLLADIGDPEETTTAPRNDTDPLLDTRLGPFRIIERIGRGGMGVVYRGTREGADFAQDVALKFIRRGFDFDDVRARFLRERRILARLDHPNLARFIDGGVAPDGRPWFALEFVRGEPVTRWCDENRLDVHARLRLFLDVCSAVEYAHEQLVVHRDLKPANILVDEAGHVRLLDFGIARLLGGDGDGDAAQPTTIGARYALTPEYAAPEQFGSEPAGVATDVYALGAVLYELVSGVLPLEVSRNDLSAAERTIRTLPPAPLPQAIARGGSDATATRLTARSTSLRAYRSDVRGDLARILDKALAKEPQRRYASVAAFADDLARWLAGAPVRVSGNAFGYRLRKFVARNRVAVALAALSLLAVVAGMAATIWQMREAQVQRDAALSAARRSDAVRTYLMLMSRDAAVQNETTRTNVREVFKKSAAKVFEEFHNDPATGQTTALMLSDLFLQLGDIEGARPLLEHLLQWPGIESNPDVQANARYNLSQVAIMRGETARARELLGQAQSWWTGRPASRAILNESRAAQAKIERAEGQLDLALATLRNAIAERRGIIEADDFETGSLLNTLSSALTQSGYYEEAAAAANESYAVFQHLNQADSDGGTAALNSRGNAAMMMGDVEHALPDFRHVAEMTRGLYGETSKLAAALNNLGIALSRLNRYDEALPVLEDALRISVEQNGERSPLTIITRVSMAELYARSGRTGDAEPLVQAAVAITDADYASNKALLAMTRRARATLNLAKGRNAEALADIEQASALYRATGKSGEVHVRLLESMRKEAEGK